MNNGLDPKLWPANRVKRRKISDLIPSARNARIHTDDQIKQIADSIQEWGWTQPVLVDEADGIIAGHGRVMAGHLLGLKQVPTITAAGWSEEKKNAYRIADNKLTELAGWDNVALMREFMDLSNTDFDLTLTGFDEETLDRMSADFHANFNPESGVKEVDGEDVAKAQGAADRRMADASRQTIVDVICPNCGKGFGIDRQTFEK